LRSVEERRVLRAPGIELYTLPAVWKVLMEDGNCILELSSTEHVGIQVSTTVVVRAKDAAAEDALQVLERLDVPSMRLQFKRRLLPIAGEGTLPDD
jgi:hypothetical protein